MTMNAALAPIDDRGTWHAAPCVPLQARLLTPPVPSQAVCVDAHTASDKARVLSGADWLASVEALHAAFAASPATRLALCLDDPFDLSCALFAAWAADKTPVMLPNTLPQTRRDFAYAYDEAIDANALSAYGNRRGNTALTANDAAPHASRLLSSSCRLVIYTSGSTGEPKAIIKSLAQLNDEVQTLHRHWGAHLRDALVVGSVPCHHIYGLWFRMLWPLAAGVPFARQTFAEPSQAHVWRTWPAVVWIAGPAQLTRWPALLGVDRWLDAPRMTFSSGGPLPEDAAHRFVDVVRAARPDAEGSRAVAPVEVFGSTETGGIAWRQQDLTSQWTPFDDTHIRVTDAGALEIRSSRVNDGQWWQTDDGAVLHANGAFTLTGRLDRIVKIEGKRLSLPSVEAALLRHIWVKDASVTVIAGRPAAAVVLESEGCQAWREQSLNAVRKTLRDALAETFDPTVLPRRWRFVMALPVNERGKRTTADVAALFSPASPWLPSVLGIRCDDVGATPGPTGVMVISMRVPPELAHFEGHFPGLPLLPGVVLVDWATRFAREHAARMPGSPVFANAPTSLQQVKFSAPVMPGARLELTLSFDLARLRVHYVYEGPRGTTASGYLGYVAPATSATDAPDTGDAAR
ncbi:AMP-binding protein [Pandoraea pnomenusa]|uniref:AMP-binding protein n=1 Tax=Pandoraea pnomenusa TaxID=93220 RepID=UPI003341D60A